MRAAVRPGDAEAQMAAPGRPARTETGMLTDSEQRNLAAVQRFIDEYQNKGDLDAFRDLMHPEFVDHSRPPHVALGPEGVRQQFDAFRSVLTGFRAEVSDTVRLRDGRIIEHWGVLNIAPLLSRAG